ncbi:MAG TPA: hypothetical protein DEQ34_13200 [Balneolaceae bacterium]|nr:hypothetical protein [Balneolaceae bacterium]|tara:strand:- start:24889 stop:25107 length:219 start_codon:yes stop_codon:yes gene_type:complete
MNIHASDHKNDHSHCEYCNSPVGKPSLINGHAFKLYKIKEPSGFKYACFDCLIKLRKEDREKYIPQEYPAAI